ncbi:MAG: Gfo/Idh/MocA family oxidoreductase [Hyphomicrobiales bacterium]|nr:Gfo/Idh/MocA family oxidoreductase [Hyphomicrobiales bacterium]
MRELGFGVVGTGYMGKAHAVALKAVGTVFGTNLRPVCEMVCSTTPEGASAKAAEYGFRRSASDWRELVNDERVEAVLIASPQWTHREIALAAFEAGKPVFCEKPLGETVDDSMAMVAAAERSGLPNMVGFNYIRTPASQLAGDMIQSGELGRIVNMRAEHTEDFLSDPDEPGSWRTRKRSGGNMGDLSPHIINAVQRLIGPITSLVADIETVYETRPGANGPERVENDDQANILCRFTSGVMGCLNISRVATGRKMGYAYEVTGSDGAIRFDGEDQNALWYYDRSTRAGRQGFTKILTGPEHPDYVNFCLGPGHGTGYNDQITIEIRDFLTAIETGEPVWPTFQAGLEVNKVIAAARQSSRERKWVDV